MNAHLLVSFALVALAAARPQEGIFRFSSTVNTAPQYQVVEQQQEQQPQLLARTLEQEVPAEHFFSKVSSSQASQQRRVVEQQPQLLARTLEQEVPAEHFFSKVSSSQASQRVEPQFYKAASQYAVRAAEPKFKILKQVQEFDPAGIYSVNFETENGIAAVEQGTVKDLVDPEGPVSAKQGSYSYTGPDGVQYTVNWVADELGFRASGAHLPQAPAIPAEIQRSLDLIAAQPQKYDEEGNPIA